MTLRTRRRRCVEMDVPCGVNSVNCGIGRMQTFPQATKALDSSRVTRRLVCDGFEAVTGVF